MDDTTPTCNGLKGSSGAFKGECIVGLGGGKGGRGATSSSTQNKR